MSFTNAIRLLLFVDLIEDSDEDSVENSDLTCVNGGTRTEQVNPSTGARRYVCTCPTHFKGEMCETCKLILLITNMVNLMMMV